jgi:hypothetical protein
MIEREYRSWRPAWIKKELARPHLNIKSGCGGAILSYQLWRRVSRMTMVQASPGKTHKTLHEK